MFITKHCLNSVNLPFKLFSLRILLEWGKAALACFTLQLYVWHSLSCAGWSNIRVEIWRNWQHMPKIALTQTLLFPFSLIIFPSPPFLSLFVFSLYLDPPFFVVASPNPCARLLPECCHLFPSLQPHESRGIFCLWHREALRLHKWCLGFPCPYFPGNLLALSHGWEQMGFLQMLLVPGWLPCSTNTGPERTALEF